MKIYSVICNWNSEYGYRTGVLGRFTDRNLAVELRSKIIKYMCDKMEYERTLLDINVSIACGEVYDNLDRFTTPFIENCFKDCELERC